MEMKSTDISVVGKKANQWLANSESSGCQCFKLSWSHYLILMRVENPDARSFYEIECVQQQWSKRQLSRQVGSCLYERLALSRDKDEVMRLAKEQQVVAKLQILRSYRYFLSCFFYFFDTYK